MEQLALGHLDYSDTFLVRSKLIKHKISKRSERKMIRDINKVIVAQLASRGVGVPRTTVAKTLHHGQLQEKTESARQHLTKVCP